MSVELKEGEWWLHKPSGEPAFVRSTRLVQVDNTRGQTFHVNGQDLEFLPRSDPRHPEHRPEVEGSSQGILDTSADDGWRRRCPIECELADEQPCLATWDDGKNRHTMRVYGESVRQHWGKRIDAWQHEPSPAPPPYSPPRGWVETAERIPTKADAEKWHLNGWMVFAEESDGRMFPKSFETVRTYPDRNKRWCTVAWMREATA